MSSMHNHVHLNCYNFAMEIDAGLLSKVYKFNSMFVQEVPTVPKLNLGKLFCFGNKMKREYLKIACEQFLFYFPNK